MLKIDKLVKFFKPIFFIISDIYLSLISLYIAYLLRFNFDIPENYYYSILKIFILITSVKLILFYFFKIYFINLNLFSLYELKKILIITTISYLFSFIIILLFKEYFCPFPRSAIIIDYILFILMISSFRITKRLFFEKLSSGDNTAIIIGMNKKTISLLKQDTKYTFLEIYENDKMLIGNYIYGFKILSLDTLTNNNNNINSVIITKNLIEKDLNDTFVFLQNKGFKNIMKYNFLNDNIKNITIEDLLARKPKDLDKNIIKSFIKDKIIMISGAGGSIGSEISKQCLKYGAKKLLLIDHSEFNLYSINEKLNSKIVIPIMESVLDYNMLEKTISKYKPDIFIHTAAYKHVPMVELNVSEGIKNNIIGTKNCIDLSIKNNVKTFILISTDKAVRPTNVMGATKRICELYAGNIDSKNTKIVSVRFGNVLGSSGSVIPKFKEQIKKGGPITVTHPNIIRYFMLISEACELVLQTGAIGKSGNICVLNMGKPIKIVDLAKKMIKLYGNKNIEIKFIGLRKGEKLYEELLIKDTITITDNNSIMIGKKTNYNINKLNKDIIELINSNNQLKKIKDILPEFNHNN